MNTNNGGVKNVSILNVYLVRPQVFAHRRKEKIEECSDACDTQKKSHRQSRPEYGATMHVDALFSEVKRESILGEYLV